MVGVLVGLGLGHVRSYSVFSIGRQLKTLQLESPLAKW